MVVAVLVGGYDVVVLVIPLLLLDYLPPLLVYTSHQQQQQHNSYYYYYYYSSYSSSSSSSTTNKSITSTSTTCTSSGMLLWRGFKNNRRPAGFASKDKVSRCVCVVFFNLDDTSVAYTGKPPVGHVIGSACVAATSKREHAQSLDIHQYRL